MWRSFRDFFLKGSLDSTSDIFERARIRMTFTFCFIGIAMLMLLNITLLAAHLYFSLVVSIAASSGFLLCIYYLKYKQNHTLGARIVVVTVFAGVTLDMLFSHTIGLVDLVWFVDLILFTFFTLHSVWGATLTILSTAVSYVYVRYFFYDNFHEETIYSTGQIVSLFISIVSGFALVFSFVKEAVGAQKEAELKLKENLLSLEELNAKLVKLNSDLQLSNKNLEAFTYSVSHDLKSPLRAVIGFSEILGEEYGSQLKEEGKELTQLIRDSANKMNDLIDDLLTFSHSGSQEIALHEVDVAELVNDVIAEYEINEGKARGQIRVLPLPLIQSDRSLLKQVFYNLVSNAIKYSSKRERPEIEIGALKGNDEYTFYVKDNGIGFDMKYAGKLFQIFQRLHADGEFKGTGIGLAIVKQIVTRLGGSVRMEAAPDKGATFYFTLPLKRSG